jgi:protein associated with RNAse G/E
MVETMLRISKRKWTPATAHCSEAFSWPIALLGTDRYGTWLGSQRGNTVGQPDGRMEVQQHDAVWLIPDAAWWLAAFWFTTATDLTIDISTPPVLEDETWSFLDLELDLFRTPDGRAGIVDQDEFDSLAASGLISDHAIATAEATAHSLLPLVQHRSEPFGDAALPWLRSLRHPSDWDSRDC